MVMMRAERGSAASVDSKIDPGEQEVQVTVAMSFELR